MGSLPDNVPNTLKSIRILECQNVKVALIIIGTLPVTSMNVKDHFLIWDHTRNTMVAERLIGLALLHIHKDIIVNIDKVIDLHATKNKRLNFC